MYPEELQFTEILQRHGITGANEARLHKALEPIRIFDEEGTYLHSLRVGILSAEIAFYTGLNSCSLVWGGAMHDVGKALLKDPKIVKKNTGFTAEDYEQIKEHVILGFNALVAEGFLFTAHIVKYHQRFGSYPYPKHIPELPSFWQGRDREFQIYGRVLALADFYDALMYRGNDRFSGGSTTAEQRRQWYIDGNRDEEHVVRLLIQKSVLVF